MKDFTTSQIRNVALVAHHGVGKTSLAEAMLFLAKATTRLGRIADGTTLLDYSADEIQRQITINLGLAQFEWAGHKINLVDTPGYMDFVGDVHSALRVADAAVLLLRANAGAEVGTEVVWEVLKEDKMPTLIVVNMMDKEHADFMGAIRSVHDRLGINAVPLQLPIGQAEAFNGIIDLIENKAYTFSGKGMEAKSQEVPIPDELKAAAAEARARLLEEAATGDEGLMEKFLGEGDLTIEEIRHGLCERVVQGDLAPAFCCSAFNNHGVKEILDEIVDVLPSPLDVKPQVGQTADVTEVVCKPAAGEPLAAVVFKTLSEQHLGDLSLMRLYSGSATPGLDLVNATRGRSEKLGTLYHLVGKERLDCKGAKAGDIVAAVKLKETHTGDTLTEKARPVKLAPPNFPAPVTEECIKAKNKGDEEKMAQALTRLHEEDPTFSRAYEPSTKESLVRGMGDLQLEVMVDRMKKRFGVEVLLSRPHVPYRETIKTKAQGEYRHKKQTGGRGQFGEVHLRLEPMERGAGFEFADEIKGGVIPNQYIPAVEKGVVAAMEKGPLSGCPVVDVRAAVFFGKYHDVDSSEMAFKIAAESCFHQVMLEARPVLLEPFGEIQVRVPEEFLGDVMGDLSSRRGKILGTESDGHHQVIRATVPMAETYKYSTQLRSMTQGRGMHSVKYSHYEEVPRELADKVIAAAKAEKEAGRTPEASPPTRMSGHSKWATIKRKKAATDAARGKTFTKAIKEITIAARQSGGDPEINPRLRSAIAAAKAVNMPAANIERAVKKGTGEIEGATIEEAHYEGYAPGGIALLIEVATDNRNRTSGDVRNILARFGGNMAEAGSVSYMFKPHGLIVVDKAAVAEDTLIEIALDAGADDVTPEGEVFEILTPPARLEAVREALAAKKIPVQSAEATKIASVTVPLDEARAGSVFRLVETLEDHEDVQKVYANYTISDELLAKFVP